MNSMFELQSRQKMLKAANCTRSCITRSKRKRFDHEYPAEMRQMSENGFMGMFIPEEYGSGGFSVPDYVVALESLLRDACWLYER